MSRGWRAALAGYAAGLATAGVILLLARGAAPGAAPAAPATVPAAASASAATTAAFPAAPRPTASSPIAPAAADPAAVPQHSAAPLSAEARARIAPLEAKLAADADDLMARKQLAIVLIQNQQLMLAYEHSTAILAAHPDDPDGLYVHAVVRLAMGQAAKSLELLDRVLARYPNHVLALGARAEAQRKIGDDGGAALTEARARQAARGGGDEVEELLAAASDGTLLEMMRSDSTEETPDASEGAAGSK